jgi:hypothetical protein
MIRVLIATLLFSSFALAQVSESAGGPQTHEEKVAAYKQELEKQAADFSFEGDMVIGFEGAPNQIYFEHFKDKMVDMTATEDMNQLSEGLKAMGVELISKRLYASENGLIVVIAKIAAQGGDLSVCVINTKTGERNDYSISAIEGDNVIRSVKAGYSDVLVQVTR